MWRYWKTCRKEVWNMSETRQRGQCNHLFCSYVCVYMYTYSYLYWKMYIYGFTKYLHVWKVIFFSDMVILWVNIEGSNCILYTCKHLYNSYGHTPIPVYIYMYTSMYAGLRSGVEGHREEEQGCGGFEEVLWCIQKCHWSVYNNRYNDM